MKNTSKLTISIGIPAYNEESNIEYLLKRLLTQKLGSNIKLKEIIVVSDGSTDDTVRIVKKFKDKRIILIVNESREGQSASQNKILKQFQGDFLVLLEADTLPADNNFISHLIAPFLKTDSHTIGLCLGNSIPLPARGFFEHIMYFKQDLKRRIYQRSTSTNNYHLVSGQRGRAISRALATKLYWTDDVPEDRYSMLAAGELGFKTVYASSAKIYFRLPGTLSDYYRQYLKYYTGRISINKYYSNGETKIRFSILHTISESIKAFIRNPVLMSTYVLCLMTVQIAVTHRRRFSPFLKVYPTTKNLIFT